LAWLIYWADIWVSLIYWYWLILSASVSRCWQNVVTVHSSCIQTTCARKHNEPSQTVNLQQR